MFQLLLPVFDDDDDCDANVLNDIVRLPLSVVVAFAFSASAASFSFRSRSSASFLRRSCSFRHLSTLSLRFCSSGSTGSVGLFDCEGDCCDRCCCCCSCCCCFWVLPLEFSPVGLELFSEDCDGFVCGMVVFTLFLSVSDSVLLWLRSLFLFLSSFSSSPLPPLPSLLLSSRR